MALDVKRLAAAQAHARSRQEHRAMEDMRLEMARQQQMAAAQARRDRKKGRIMGAVQGGLGLASIAAIPFTGGMSGAMAPALLGGGLSMLGSGAGTATGNPELGAMAGGIGQMAAMGVSGYQRDQAMKGLASQLAAPTYAPPTGPATLNEFGDQQFNLQLPTIGYR